MTYWWDVFLIGALIVAAFVVYAISRWLSAEWRMQGIQDELDDMDRGRLPDLTFDNGMYSAPRNPNVRMGALPDRKYDEIEARRLRLVVGGSSRSLH